MQGTREREAGPVLPGRCWQDVVLAAQRDLAGTLDRAIGQGQLTTDPYRGWLALESRLCTINAEALDRAAAWHGAQPALQAQAHGWAAALRNDAALAAKEATSRNRRIPPPHGASPDAAPSALPTQDRAAVEIEQWREFMAMAVPSAQAGEALGVVALHARLMRGPMREAIGAVAALPWVAGIGCRYLLQRREPDATTSNDHALLDAYAASALTVGAQRATDWYRAAMQRVLRPTEPASPNPLPGT